VEDGSGVLIGVIVFIFGGVVLLITAMNNRRRLLEIAYRERVAMIERGLVPSPESDPAGFESATGLGMRKIGSSGERYRTAGVIMIGLGLSLMVLLTFAAGVPDIGLGVGGAWAVLGGACLLNYFLLARREIDSFGERTRWQSAPTRTPNEPPPTITP
jgi:hypothetical protein